MINMWWIMGSAAKLCPHGKVKVGYYKMGNGTKNVTC